MKLFFQFFWRGIKNLLCVIFWIACAISPICLSVICSKFLSTFLSEALTVILAIAICVIGYYILYLIIHCVSAVKYCKKTNTDSLNTAWETTSWFY